MSLLDVHLEQISISAAAISDLPFPPPRIFTNALLHQHDITALIRDTEAHERALFAVPPGQPPVAHDPATGSTRRNTVFNVDGGDVWLAGAPNTLRAPRRNTAVATVLGGHMVEQIRKGGGGVPGPGAGYSAAEGKERGEMDVEVLLRGAEKLCGVYPIAGAAEKITSLRARYAQLSSSIAHHETRVSRQTAQLDRRNRPHDFDDEDDDDDYRADLDDGGAAEITDEDLRREEEDIKELEKKKRALEDRVSGMERDLGGLLR
ncbi:MAG: hypothetical protein M1832_005558 [Thelocarpon impressellum]|nr:MAG: hypothetical protein M1832_005558 [Thelocarpon impressellum]